LFNTSNSAAATHKSIMASSEPVNLHKKEQTAIMSG